MKRIYMLTGAFIALIGLPHAHAQSTGPSTLNAAGGSRNTGGLIYDWSVGEMTMVSTFYKSDVIVTQGLLQNDISRPASVATPKVLQDLQVFPNPASAMLSIAFTSTSPGSLSYRLLDMTGKTIVSHSSPVKMGTNVEELNIAGLAAATYMLEVGFNNDDASENTSFKIQKLK